MTGSRVPAPAGLTAAPEPGSAASAAFAVAVREIEAGLRPQLRDRVIVAEHIAPPRRLAPFAAAMAVTVFRPGPPRPGPDDPDQIGDGHLILLHDPKGRDAWHGTYRLTALVRADIEPELAADSLLGQVGWSWLTEALDGSAPGYTALSGTVTRELTEGFGGKDDEPPISELELRASWSPVPGQREDENETAGTGLDLAGHVLAWVTCLTAATGLEPPGTRALPLGGPRRTGSRPGGPPRRGPYGGGPSQGGEYQ